jgi:hypothetical protein
LLTDALTYLAIRASFFQPENWAFSDLSNTIRPLKIFCFVGLFLTVCEGILDEKIFPSEGQSSMKKFATVFILLLMAASVTAEQGGKDAKSIYVSGRAVVFFAPSWDEYVALPEKDKDAIDEALYDFAHSQLQVLSYLEANGIQGISTASQNIQIQIAPNEVIYYLRSDFDYPFGLIMTDGQNEPKIFMGAASESELKSMFAEFFSLQ